MHRSRQASAAIAVVLLLFGGVLSLHGADPTATVRGAVFDQSGGAVPDVKLEITHQGTRLKRTIATNALGSFIFPLLPIGSYELTAAKAGFRRYVQTGIVLTVNAEVTVNVSLQVGAVDQSVTVSGEASLVNTQTAMVRQLVSGEQIDKLPLNGRNVLQLTLLTGGVLDTGGSNANQGFIHQNARVYPSASGGRADSMNFILDGATNNDRYTNVSLPFPNPDAVAEFSFLSNSFSAEYGAALGGVVNAVSKTGTNELHGSAFEYLRNSRLNASNFFTPGVSDRLKRNQVGFSVGGPVELPRLYKGRDRTFFFLSWQQMFLRQSPVNSSTRTWRPEELEGDFSYQSGQTRRTLLDPLTGQPMPGSKIPASRFDPVSLKLARMLPVGDPVTGLLTYRAARSIVDNPQWLARVDHMIGSRNRLNLRYFRDFYDEIPDGDPNNPFLCWGSAVPARSQSYLISDTHIFSPRLLGAWSFTYARILSPNSFNMPGPADGKPSSLGIQGIPDGMLDVYAQVRMPAGFKGYFQKIYQNTFQYQGSVTYVVNRHEMKWGIDYHRAQLNQFRDAAQPIFRFGTTYSNFTEADFLMGFPNSFSATSSWAESLRQPRLHLYFQDNIRVSRRLAVNVGIRYDPFMPWVEKGRDTVTLWRPGLKSQRFPKLPTGAVVAGDPGVPQHGYSRDMNNLAPRLGFAFDPTGKARTAIRGGAGIFFGQPPGGTLNQMSMASFPFINSVSVTSPGSMGAGGFSNVFRTGTSAAISNPFLGGTGAPTADTPVPSPLTYYSTAADYVLAYTAQWNLSVEHQLAPGTTASVTYIGSKSTHLQAAQQLNPAIYIPGVGADGKALSTTANVNDRRPYGPALGSIVESQSDSNSNHNALALGFRKRYGGGHWWSRSTIDANFTWSHTLDVQDSSINAGSGGTRHPFNDRLDYGNADFDRRHRLVLSYVWDLPRMDGYHRILRGVLGSWSTSSIVTLQSGGPFSIASGIDRNFGLGGNFADQVLPDATLPGDRSKQDKILKWFNTAAFGTNALGTVGNTGRNILRAPGLATVDFSVVKSFPLGSGEKRRLEFRGDFFNFFNRTNLGNPTNNAASTLFGRILSAGSPRIVQLAGKIYF